MSIEDYNAAQQQPAVEGRHVDYAAENAKRALAAMGLGSLSTSLDAGSQRLKTSMGLPSQTTPPSFRSQPPELVVPSREDLYPPAGNRSTDLPSKEPKAKDPPFWPSDQSHDPAVGVDRGEGAVNPTGSGIPATHVGGEVPTGPLSSSQASQTAAAAPASYPGNEPATASIKPESQSRGYHTTDSSTGLQPNGNTAHSIAQQQMSARTNPDSSTTTVYMPQGYASHDVNLNTTPAHTPRQSSAEQQQALYGQDTGSIPVPPPHRPADQPTYGLEAQANEPQPMAAETKATDPELLQSSQPDVRQILTAQPQHLHRPEISATEPEHPESTSSNVRQIFAAHPQDPYRHAGTGFTGQEQKSQIAQPTLHPASKQETANAWPLVDYEPAGEACISSTL